MIGNYLKRTTSAAPLAVFRIAFGFLLFAGVIRFWAKGWIYDLYIKPKFFFTFYGFEFVKPLGEFTYVVFALCAIAALFVAVGYFYRISSIALFLSFTYIELIDKTTYLNHYYFISMISLLMIFLPAHCYFSIDASRSSDLKSGLVPSWTIDSLKLFVCFLYFFAGMAKVNSDWLLNAQPLRIWLPAKNDLPVIGKLFNHVWVAYAFSWIGCIYDLSIGSLLWNKSTRLFAYFAVVVFHVLTSMLFPIGMFPYIMIATALIFFSPQFHERIISAISKILKVPYTAFPSEKTFQYSNFSRKVLLAFVTIFFIVQIAMPFRYALYPGELFWTEEGYRFSWRVMLMEKAGLAEFTVRDKTGKEVRVENADFLTPLQEKQMSFQPDMILQYSHFLRDHYSSQGYNSPEVYVDSYVTLNGRLGRPLIDPYTDLAKEKDSFRHKPWILSLNDEIKGL